MKQWFYSQCETLSLLLASCLYWLQVRNGVVVKHALTAVCWAGLKHAPCYSSFIHNVLFNGHASRRAKNLIPYYLPKAYSEFQFPLPYYFSRNNNRVHLMPIIRVPVTLATYKTKSHTWFHAPLYLVHDCMKQFFDSQCKAFSLLLASCLLLATSEKWRRYKTCINISLLSWS